MKKNLLVLLMAAIASFAYSQQPENASNAFKKVNIILSDGSSVSGLTRLTRLKAGVITILTSDNKKTTYEASDIKEFTIDSSKYVTRKDEFFLEVIKGSKLSLYQKQSSVNGKIGYNGVEPIVLTGNDGNINDYYLCADKDLSFHLISKRNFTNTIKGFCERCTALASDINNGKLTFADIKQIVITYNNCN